MSRRITLTEDDFEYPGGYSTGSEEIVAEHKVPPDRVYHVPVGRPIIAMLATSETVTVSANSTETKTLSPAAPQAPFLPDPTAGQYGPSAYIVSWFDDSGDGNKDTRVTDTTNVQYSSFTSSDNLVTDIEFQNTTGSNEDVKIYKILRDGYVRLQKRTAGKRNKVHEFQSHDTWRMAYVNPDAPDVDRRVNWLQSASGVSGVIAPKQTLDIEFFDDSVTPSIDDGNDGLDSKSNVEISLPMETRKLRPDESPEQLRQRVRSRM